MLTYRLFSFFSRLLKTFYGFFPTTDVNLSTCSDATFENSLRTLPNNGCCSIAYSISTPEISLRILQNVDVNLLLVQTPSSEMFQNMDAFLILVHSPITYSVSCIMTLHITNSLPLQVRSVDRQKSLSSENSFQE